MPDGEPVLKTIGDVVPGTFIRLDNGQWILVGQTVNDVVEVYAEPEDES